MDNGRNDTEQKSQMTEVDAWMPDGKTSNGRTPSERWKAPEASSPESDFAPEMPEMSEMSDMSELSGVPELPKAPEDNRLENNASLGEALPMPGERPLEQMNRGKQHETLPMGEVISQSIGMGKMSREAREQAEAVEGEDKFSAETAMKYEKQIGGAGQNLAEEVDKYYHIRDELNGLNGQEVKK